MKPCFDIDATPAELGLPAKFNAWRPAQHDVALQIAQLSNGVIVLKAPTGFGKTVAYLSAALISGKRACILIGTKILQSQLLEDAGGKVCDVRGRSSFTCAADGGSCAEAECRLGGFMCEFRQQGACDYFNQFSIAKQSQLVSTNYALFFAHKDKGSLGSFDLLICDEAHDIEHWVDSAMRVPWISEKYLEKAEKGLSTLKKGENITKKQLLAVLEVINDRIEQFKSEGKRSNALKLQNTTNSLLRVLTYGDVFIADPMRAGFKFHTVYIQKFAQRCLFDSAPAVAIVSATVNEKTCQILGLNANKYALQHIDVPATIPAQRRPVYWYPTCKISYGMPVSDEMLQIQHADAIITARQGFKGIVHTHSYARAKMFVERSAFGKSKLLLAHTPQNTAEVVRQFIGTKEPCFIVSPALTTGYDFPGELCRWAIILKVPFPNMQDALIAARKEQDKTYLSYLAAQALEQTVGRGCRSPEDWCETWVLDDTVWRFKRYAGKFMSRHFLATIKRKDKIGKEVGVRFE